MRALLVLLSVVAVAWAQIVVNTPTGVVTCQNTLITWSGGPAQTGDSFIVQIAPADTPNGELFAGATGLRDSPYTWFVNAPVNTRVVVRILTIGRQSAESGVFVVQAGPSQDCTGTSIAPSSSSTQPTPEISPTIPIPVPNPVVSTPTNPSSTSSPESSASSTSASTSSSPSSSTGSLSASRSLTSQTNGSLQIPGDSSTDSTGGKDPPSNPPNIGVIAGAAAGGSAALILLIIGLCVYLRRKRSSAANTVARPHYTKAKMQGGTTPPIITTPFIPPGEPVSSSTAPPSSSQYDFHDSTHSSTAPTGSPFDPAKFACAPPLAAPPAAAIAAISQDHHPPTPAQVHESISPGQIEDLPPLYQDHAGPSGRGDEAEQALAYDALIRDFCATNRDLISPLLERKLHAARYMPRDNPADASAEYWQRAYGVEFFELRRLQEAYERNVATMAAINMPEKALPQAALSAKEKALLSRRGGGY